VGGRDQEGLVEAYLALGVLAAYDVNQAMNLTAQLSAGEHGDKRRGIQSAP
jgi:hypothetical protein